MFTINDIEKTFSENSDPERAKKMAAYMRNQFDFYGLMADKRRALSKPYIKEGKKAETIEWIFLKKLFSHNYREINYLGIDLLKANSHLLSPCDFDNLVDLAKIRPWWDTIDNIDGIIGKLTDKDRDFKRKILNLSQNPNFWLRRIAIGHQRKFKEKTDTNLLAKIINTNLKIPCTNKDEKFFIDKAIGWALREYSKKNPSWVKSFLAENKNDLSKLSTREASKYL